MTPASARPAGSSLELPPTSLSPKRAGVQLWRPQIVLASRVDVAPCSPVTLATPAASPQAVRTQLEFGQALSEGLVTARQILGAHAAHARERAARASSDSERVTATLAAYRAEVALDEVLTGTLREVTALLERRWLR